MTKRKAIALAVVSFLFGTFVGPVIAYYVVMGLWWKP